MEALLKTILMGIVEGITEFLPVSSTGHLLLTNELIHFDKVMGGEKAAKAFEIIGIKTPEKNKTNARRKHTKDNKSSMVNRSLTSVGG